MTEGAYEATQSQRRRSSPPGPCSAQCGRQRGPPGRSGGGSSLSALRPRNPAETQLGAGSLTPERDLGRSKWSQGRNCFSRLGPVSMSQLRKETCASNSCLSTRSPETSDGTAHESGSGTIPRDPEELLMAGERAEDFSSTGSWHDTKPQTWKVPEKPIFSVSGDSSAGPHPCEHHNPGFNRRTERGCGGRAAARPPPKGSRRLASPRQPGPHLCRRARQRGLLPRLGGACERCWGSLAALRGGPPGAPQGPGLCRPRNARRAAGDGQAAAGCQAGPERACSPRQPAGSGLPPLKVPFGAVAQKAEAQPLGRSSPHVAASKLPFLD